MCGISGLISKNNNFIQEDLIKINKKLNHRGPDEDGYYFHKNLGIGHKRLSIIDLSTGKQPMHNDNKDLSITYNGELYNYKELRNSLIKKGLRFHTNSDTEVVLKAYEYYGNTCVNHFRGMFAFAIINKEKKELFIARDHIGIKPIVYYQDENSFAFASEIKALSSTPNFVKDIDYYAIDQYLTYQYIPAPRTIFNNVKKLLPGHFMVVGFDGLVKVNKKYWDISFKPITKSNKDWLRCLSQEIKESVKKHMVSDVEFGAFLSGGIDSTLIVKYMTELRGEGIKTYTIGFKDSKVDETPWATKVSKKYKTNHTSLLLEGNALDILPKLVKHYGEPFGDFSSVPTFYVSQIAAKDVKMVLSGDGADEAFAGYSHYPGWKEYKNTSEEYLYKNNFVKKWYPLANLIRPKKYPKINNPCSVLDNYLPWRQRMVNAKREKLWKSKYSYILNLPNELVYNYQESFAKNGEFSGSQYFDIKTFLPSCILTKVDIASMMSSLEVRTPLTDKRIYELAATIPPELLINKENGTWSGKHIFKKLLEPDFDDDFIYRKKQGFEIPLDKWLFEIENLKTIKERFNNPKSILNELFNNQFLNELLMEKKAYDVWLLLVLDEWFCQEFN